MWIVSIVLLGIAGGLFVAQNFQRKKVFLMKSTKTSTAAELKTLAKSVAEDIGPGSFHEYTEVKGKSETEEPLISELAEIQCVSYTMKVSREYEETYYTTDSEGRNVQRTRRGSEIVSSNSRMVPFDINDGTGKIRINPEGAKMVTEKVFSRFDQGEPQGMKVSMGKFNINLGNMAPKTGRRTIGYRYEEEIVPLNRELYIIGEASDSSGQLQMQLPDEKEQKYIISVKSEEELTRSAEGLVKGFLYGSIACVVLAAAIFIISFFI